MRSLLLIAFTLFAFMNQVSAKGNPQTTSIRISAHEQAIVLNLVGQIGKVESFLLTDKTGKVIYQDDIEKNKKRIKYDLQQLPDDVYQIKVMGEYSIEYHRISISNGLVSLSETKSYTRPLIVTLEDKILINASSTNEENIGLSIYDKRGEVVYSFDEVHKGDYHKAFSLENLRSGEYKVFVGTEHFFNEIQISK